MGNGWQIGQVKTLKSSLDACVTVSNIDVSDSGIDTESDEDYRKRILLCPRSLYDLWVDCGL